jgi:uncharacterized membrane protein YbhN (UPF0104 family)
MIQNKNIKLLVNYGLGPLLFLWLSWSIYQQLIHQPNLNSTIDRLWASFKGPDAWKIWTALLLVLVNWGLEAVKWQILLKPLEQISITKAIKAILAGVAFSINTPNRIGEYGGRVLYVKDGHRWQAVSLTIAGSLSQLIVTLAAGVAGLLALLSQPSLLQSSAVHALWVQALLYGTIAVTVFLCVLYFKLSWLVKWLKKIPRGNNFLKHIAVIENLDVRFLLRVIGLSLLRYIVFVIQFILLLQLFIGSINTGIACMMVSIVYLVLAIIPTIALAEIGIRGKVSLLLFGMITTNTLGIVAATLAIWCINLIIPAIIGTILFASLKIFSDK